MRGYKEVLSEVCADRKRFLEKHAGINGSLKCITLEAETFVNFAQIRESLRREKFYIF